VKARNQLILLNAKEQYESLLPFFDRHVIDSKLISKTPFKEAGKTMELTPQYQSHNSIAKDQ
jgi:hypothetical protein